LAAADDRPLAGKRIVVTRAPEQAGELIERLSALGAEVIALPLLEFVPVEETSSLDDAIRMLVQFDWLIFTSQNAVTFFARRCNDFGIPLKSISDRTKVAAVGPVTANAAGMAGFTVHFVSAEAHGAGLAAGLGMEMKGKRVLLPRSDRARPDLPAALRDAGAEVVEVIAYRTAAPEKTQTATLERVLRGEVDVITCASPSAFDRLAELIGIEELRRLATQVTLAAIGPVTADAIRHAGLLVAIEADQPTSAGFAAAIVKYYCAASHARVTRR
jgi:uroporphyrinogen III methyltransferase/synthase